MYDLSFVTDVVRTKFQEFTIHVEEDEEEKGREMVLGEYGMILHFSQDSSTVPLASLSPTSELRLLFDNEFERRRWSEMISSVSHAGGVSGKVLYPSYFLFYIVDLLT